MITTDVDHATRSHPRVLGMRVLAALAVVAGGAVAWLVPLALALSDPETWLAVCVVVAAPAVAIPLAGRLMSVTSIASHASRRTARADRSHSRLQAVRGMGRKATPAEREVGALLAGLDAAPSAGTTVRDARFHSVDARYLTLVADLADVGGSLGPHLMLARTSHAYTVSPRVRTGPLPVDVGRLDLYPADFDRTPDGTVRLTAPALNDVWRVPVDQAERAAAVLDGGTIEALNTWHQPHVAVAIRTIDTVAFTDGHPQVDPVGMAEASAAVHRALRPELRGTGTPSDPRVGGLRSDSSARRAQHWRGIAGLLAIGLLSAAAVITAVEGEPYAGLLAPWTLLWLQTGVLLVVGTVATLVQRNWAARQRAVAVQARAVADGRGWSYRQRDDALAEEWSVRPFARVQRLTASPSTSGESSRGTTVGMAYLEGDLGPWPVSRVFCSRVVWAALPEGAPEVTIVRRDLAARALAVVAGDDITVESAAFNEHWSVRADDARGAHALLSPAVIAVLLDIAETGIAFTTDGGRVVLWDDGTQRDIDLEERLDLVDRLAAAMPRFWDRPPVRPSQG